MFDISWTEFLLIGVVALVVIGPKELPGVLRTLGQWTRKVRGMANEFQNQFQEAMREAEMADLKKEVDNLAHDFKHYDPLKDVREDVEAVSKDIQSSLDSVPETKAALPATDEFSRRPSWPPMRPRQYPKRPRSLRSNLRPCLNCRRRAAPFRMWSWPEYLPTQGSYTNRRNQPPKRLSPKAQGAPDEPRRRREGDRGQ